MNRKLKKIIYLLLPYVAVAVTILTYYIIPDSGQQKQMAHPYLVYLLLIIAAVCLLFLVIGIFHRKTLNALIGKSPFITGVIGFLCVLNILNSKTTLLPTIYFPSLDRIFGLMAENWLFLLQNAADSLLLLVQGFAWGAVIGFFTGLALGYNQKVYYWLNPLTKFIGPIPTTAWIPLALSVFATTHAANVFLIAFAVWFPTTLMTSSGVSSVSKVHFEVSRTLGASTAYQIVHVAIPAAMPSIFIGLFYGTVNSFATLMAVEMNGNSSGIGWYINWEKQMMLYDGVYAGLIVIALICSLILTLLIRVRSKVLIWQKGIIRW